MGDDDLYARQRQACLRIREILQEFDRPEHAHATMQSLLLEIGNANHRLAKHLQIFPLREGRYGVFVCNLEDRHWVVRPLYFSTKAQAEDFVARVRAGMDQQELKTFFAEYALPHERIGIEELRRRAEMDDPS